MNTRRPSATTTAAWSSLLAAALLLGALAFLGRPVEAAPVHYVDDTGSDAANDCSSAATPCATIAHALAQADAGDTIEIGDGDYTEPGLTIDKDITLDGAGIGSTIVQAHANPGSATDRVIKVVAPAAEVLLKELTVRHGVVPADEHGGGIENGSGHLTLDTVEVTLNEAHFGGGVSNRPTASLTVIDSDITHNQATLNGGGIYSSDNLSVGNSAIEQNTAGASGGGIAHSGTSTIVDTTIAQNHSATGGGVGLFINSHATLTGSTIQNNTASNNGGGIFLTNAVDSESENVLNLSDTNVLQNTTANNGGGIYVAVPFDPSGTNILTISGGTVHDNTGTEGGGIWNGGTATVESGAVIDANGASGNGGGVFNQGTFTLDGAEVKENSAGSNEGGGIFNDGGTLNVQNGAFVGGNSAQIGGGIANQAGGQVEVVESNINLNSATVGGGIYNTGVASSLTATNSAFSTNTASTTGGAIYNATNGTIVLTSTNLLSNKTLGGAGGGLWNDGTATIHDGVINQNAAAGGNGGGIYNGLNGVLTLDEATVVSANHTQPSHDGGGIYNDGGDVDVLDNTAVNGNVAKFGAGIANRAGGTLDIVDSQVSVNKGATSGSGAGIFNADVNSEVTITNSVIAGNDSAATGGGISADGGSVNVHDSTFTENTALDAGGAVYVASGSVVIDDASYFEGNSVQPAGTGAVAHNAGGALRIEESAIVNNDYPVGGSVIYTTGGATTVWQNWWGAADGPGGDGPGTGEPIFNAGGALTYQPWLTTVELDANPSSASTGTSVDVTAIVRDSDTFSAGVAPMVASFTHSEAPPPEDVVFPLMTPSEATHTFTAAGTPDTVTASILFRGFDVGLTGQVVVNEPPPPADIDTEDEDVPTLLEDGEEIAIDPACFVEATVPDAGNVTLATSGDCPRVRVTAPEGSLPAGHRLVLGIPANLEDIPDGAVLGFIVQLQTADEEVVTDALNLPVQIQVRVDRSLLPASGPAKLAFWNGTEWVELQAEVDASGDGPVILTAEVDHFTIFGVVEGTACLLTPEPAGSGVSLAKASGCAIEDLPAADAYWVTVDGRFIGYNPIAPDFVNTSFFALYADGIIPEGTAFIVVR